MRCLTANRGAIRRLRRAAEAGSDGFSRWLCGVFFLLKTSVQAREMELAMNPAGRRAVSHRRRRSFECVLKAFEKRHFHLTKAALSDCGVPLLPPKSAISLLPIMPCMVKGRRAMPRALSFQSSIQRK